MSIVKSIRVGIMPLKRMRVQGSGRRAVKPVAVARSVDLTLDIGLGDASAPGRVVRRRTEGVVA